jgi:hypothetical protein
MQQPSESAAMQLQQQQQASQQSASSDTGPSSRLLMEDAHQGKTSACAQRSIDRYAQFVAAQRAPVASMNYSPFTRSDHGAAAQHNGASHIVDASLWNSQCIQLHASCADSYRRSGMQRSSKAFTHLLFSECV